MDTSTGKLRFFNRGALLRWRHALALVTRQQFIGAGQVLPRLSAAARAAVPTVRIKAREKE